MPRGNGLQTKVILHGKNDTFVVFVESAETLNNWKKDRSIPLAQVVAGFKVMHTQGHSVTGILAGASKATLENEFGTSNDDEVILKILEGGEVQEHENAERQGTKNITKGGTVAH